jgi:hypothetical protein
VPGRSWIQSCSGQPQVPTLIPEAASPADRPLSLSSDLDRPPRHVVWLSLFLGLGVCVGQSDDLGTPPMDDGAGGSAPAAPRLHKAAVSVDTASRSAVVTFYRETYLASMGVAIGWDGDVGQCVAGDNEPAYKDATILRVNYLRAMAGLPGDVVLDDTWNAKCQEAALMMSAQGSLSHTPDTSWACYTAGGKEAAGKSNLYLGQEGPAAMDGYVDDPGSNNQAVGHRRWILYPPAKVVGCGNIPSGGGQWSANALWVIGGNGARPSSPTFVAWPPPGYVPYVLLPDSSSRWSFSLPGASFASTSVSMQHAGTNIPVQLEPVHNGYGDNTLVWIPNRVATTRPQVDESYDVSVSEVVVSGSTRSFQYTVTVIDPTVPELTVVLKPGNQLEFRWALLSAGYRLQSAPSLDPAAEWTYVGSNPQSDGQFSILTVTAPAGPSFYRLRNP